MAAEEGGGQPHEGETPSGGRARAPLPVATLETLTTRRLAVFDETIRERASRIAEEFAALEDWVARYGYLVRLGDRLPGLDGAGKTAENRVPGCQYRLWIHAERGGEDGTVRFRAACDARLARGLAALVIQVLDGLPAEVIAGAELGFLEEMDLPGHLSAHRRNGLRAIVHHVKARARRLHEGEAEGDREVRGTGGAAR